MIFQNNNNSNRFLWLLLLLLSGVCLFHSFILSFILFLPVNESVFEREAKSGGGHSRKVFSNLKRKGKEKDSQWDAEREKEKWKNRILTLISCNIIKGEPKYWSTTAPFSWRVDILSRVHDTRARAYVEQSQFHHMLFLWCGAVWWWWWWWVRVLQHTNKEKEKRAKRMCICLLARRHERTNEPTAVNFLMDSRCKWIFESNLTKKKMSPEQALVCSLPFQVIQLHYLLPVGCWRAQQRFIAIRITYWVRQHCRCRCCCCQQYNHSLTRILHVHSGHYLALLLSQQGCTRFYDAKPKKSN